MDPTKGSIRPQVDLANGERHAAWVPPMCDVFGLSPRLEDNGARRIETTRYHDCAVGGSCDFRCSNVLHCWSLLIASCAHVFSLSSASLSGSRPGWQISAPRSGERVQATQRYP